ncbi:MAG: helix-turn-helix transcriptional regulator [Fimbriimonas ginsengisoli]|uniref:Helix-turn-helix transcriptional regulator n=1 Tax=Fimbriimonas ginsengisoli TaxID=1005039 RepID=A0A931LUX0_FIMGI|nr:helix-turn-helix transcriptional regulator [Fimbriimonas ginsengisoli]
MKSGSRQKDHLDELIEESCKDPEFANAWKQSEARLALARLRKLRNLTQQQVADRMGVARPRVAEIERNPLRVSLGRMLRYAEAVGVSLAAVEAELGLKRAS